MRILITGSTGLVGESLVRNIDLARHDVAVIVRNIKKAGTMFRGLDIRYIKTGPGFERGLKKFRPEMVVHLASYLTSAHDAKSVRKLIQSNIVFGTVLLDSLRKTGVKYFVNTGSFSEYRGRKLGPAYFYSATKTAFRTILSFYQELTGFKIVNVIPYSIYGVKSRQKKVIDYIFDSLYEPISMTEGKQVLDFIHIDDVVGLYTKIIENCGKIKRSYSEYHAGTGVGTSIRNLAKRVERETNMKTNIRWGETPYRENDIMHAVAPKKAISEIGWKPRISLKKGIEMMV